MGLAQTEAEKGILDLGTTFSFYEDHTTMQFRADAAPWGVPVMFSINPEVVDEDTIELDSIGFGIKYPEPFKLNNTYVLGKTDFQYTDEGNLTFSVDQLELGVGYQRKVGMFKVRLEGMAEDFLDGKDRAYKLNLVTQYVF